MNHNKNFLIVLFAFLAGILVSVSFAANPVDAGLFGDAFRRIFPLLREEGSAPEEIVTALPYESAESYEEAVIFAVEDASPAVVSITISKNVPIIENCRVSPFGNLPPEFRPFFDFDFFEPCETGTELREVGGGSGFIVSTDGFIVTNKHVVFDNDAEYSVLTNDGEEYKAEIIARDPIQDIALIKIEGRNFPVVRLGDSDAVKLGQTVVAIGNALGEFRNTVSVGVISGLSRDIVASGQGIGTEEIRGLFQTDAAINEGNSGGPLLNLRGEVVGVNTAVVSGAQNIGFAIPVNDAKRDVESVRRLGKIELPYLGVRYVTLTPELAEEEGMRETRGALVRGENGDPAIVPGSPAEKAGIHEGDVIVKINTIELDNQHRLGDVIARLPVGGRVKIVVRRGGEEITLTVVLEKRPE